MEDGGLGCKLTDGIISLASVTCNTGAGRKTDEEIEVFGTLSVKVPGSLDLWSYSGLPSGNSL
jgi:hypothetical protein